MSYDLFAMAQKCDNLIILERYKIDPFDFRTLHLASDPSINMRAPINGVSMVRLYLKGTLVHPNDPTYGYSVVPDPSRVEADYTFSKIMFNQPVRALNSMVEVTYFTRQAFCIKCGGTGRVLDWMSSQAGSLNHVTGAKKLAQQALKYVLTSKNPFNPSLACPIRDYIGKKFGINITENDIAAAVSKVLASYQSIQRAQKTVQTMDPQEMIQDVVAVEARQDPSDPTVVYLAIEVNSFGSSQPIPLNVMLQSNS